MPVGGTPPPACPGNFTAPEAAAGNLCVYLKATAPEGGTAKIGISDPTADSLNPNGLLYALGPKTTQTLGDGRIARFGFQFTIFAPEESGAQAVGTWAVTGN